MTIRTQRWLMGKRSETRDESYRSRQWKWRRPRQYYHKSGYSAGATPEMGSAYSAVQKDGQALVGGEQETYNRQAVYG